MEQIKEKFNKVKEEGKDLRKEVKKKTLGYILAGLGLVAGLSWNETIKAFIDYIFPAEGNSLLASLIYSVFITILVVVFSVYMTRLFKDDE